MGSEGALLTQHFQTIATIMENISIIMGVLFVLLSLFKFKRHGETRTMMSHQYTIAEPLLMLIAGAMLLILPSFIGSMLLAFWGTATPLPYPGSGGGYSSLVPPIILFVRIIGVGAFIRGIILLSRSGGQQSQHGTFGKAVIHIFAGILCVHILGTVNLLEQLLGIIN